MSCPPNQDDVMLQIAETAAALGVERIEPAEFWRGYKANRAQAEIALELVRVGAQIDALLESMWDKST